MQKSKYIYTIHTIEKAMNFHSIIIPIKSVCNDDKNNYCYNIRKSFL